MSAQARVGVLAIALGAFCAWLGLRAPAFEEPTLEVSLPVHVDAPPAAVSIPRALPSARPLQVAATKLAPDVDPHPHPITPERERLQRELQLIGALNDAVDLADGALVRELVARYRAHDPSDEQGMQAGYERIADCLERPGEEARARAQEYYDRERASILRRYVRRHCLE